MYTGQRQQQFEFVAALAAVDVQKNGEEQGYLAKKHIVALVRELFKKKEDQMEELVAAFDVQVCFWELHQKIVQLTYDSRETLARSQLLSTLREARGVSG